MARPLTPAQQKMLERLRAASRAGIARRRYDRLLDDLAFAARDRLLFHPRANSVVFEGIRFPVGSGAMTVAALDPETFTPLVSAIRSHADSSGR